MPKLKTESTEPKTAGDLQPGGNARAMLFNQVQRIERLEEEIRGLSEDKKEVYAESKGMGFDTAILRKVISRRKHNASDVREADDILDLYETTIAAAEKDELEQSEADGE